jgi:hypothetical protein
LEPKPQTRGTTSETEANERWAVPVPKPDEKPTSSVTGSVYPVELYEYNNIYCNIYNTTYMDIQEPKGSALHPVEALQYLMLSQGVAAADPLGQLIHMISPGFLSF